MKQNRNFGKLENGTLTYAPIPLKVVTHHHDEEDVPIIDPETGEPTGETEHIVRDWDTVEVKLHPTADDYAQMGWLPVVDNPPPESPIEGWHYKLIGWCESGGKIMHQYVLEKDPPPAPRTFSKLKCVAALMQAGVWAEVKAWIEQAGLYDLYLAAQDFREDNEYFVTGKTQLMASLGWTEEQAEAILQKCVIGY